LAFKGQILGYLLLCIYHVAVHVAAYL